LNYQYSSLLSGMYEIGYGEKSDLTIPEFEVGYSKSITERFTDTFGDLSHLQVSEVSLPEGWTFSEIMNEATASRNAEVAEFYDSEVYSSVSNRISIGDCFAAAQEGIEMPDIPSTTDLIANMLGASVYGKYKVKGEANNNFDIIDQAVSITTIDNSPGLADEMTKWWSDSFKVCTDSLTAFLEPDEEQQQTTDAADAYTGVYGGDVYVGDLPTDSYPSMDSEFVM